MPHHRILWLLTLFTAIALWQPPGDAAAVEQSTVSGAGDSALAAARERLDQAREGRIDLLSPGHFEKAREHYMKAANRATKGAKPDSYLRDLGRCGTSMNQAFESAELARPVLGGLVRMRQEILDARQQAQSLKEFRGADQELREAALKIEKGKIQDTPKLTRKAALGYRQAAVKIIREFDLRLARDRLKEARGRILRENYSAADNALKQMERRVNQMAKTDFNPGQFISLVQEGIRSALASAGIGEIPRGLLG